MNQWKEYKLGEYLDLISGYAFKSSNFHTENQEGYLPVIKIKNVANGDTNLNEVVYHKYEESISKFKVSKGDILIAMTGNHPQAVTQVVGAVSKYKLTTNALLNQRVGKFVSIKNIDLNFVYYLFKDEEIHYNLANKSSGSANQANISKSDILNLEVKLPPLPEQRAIASILTSLDDKIDLLHRQNATLEALAETLFRQWFVEEAEESWEKGKLGDISTNVRNGINPEQISADLPYIGLEHIDKKCIALNSFGSPENLMSNKFLFAENDILFGKLRPYFHKVCFAPFDGVCSTDILVIRPKSKLYFTYCLFAYFQKDVVDFSDASSGGTRMPRTSWEVLKDYEIDLPDVQTLKRFNDIVLPYIKKIKSNITQIRTLTQLRDTLLPKLMSGEVRVNF